MKYAHEGLRGKLFSSALSVWTLDPNRCQIQLLLLVFTVRILMTVSDPCLICWHRLLTSCHRKWSHCVNTLTSWSQHLNSQIYFFQSSYWCLLITYYATYYNYLLYYFRYVVYHVSCCPAVLEVTFVSLLSVVFSNASSLCHSYVPELSIFIDKSKPWTRSTVSLLEPFLLWLLWMALLWNATCSLVLTCWFAHVLIFLIYFACVGAFSSLLLSRVKKI